MRTLPIALLAATLSLAAGAAAAQVRTTMSETQAGLEARIDAALRGGELSRDEAGRLRAETRAFAELEARYRTDGLSAWERDDLDRRYADLARRIEGGASGGEPRWEDARWERERPSWREPDPADAFDERAAELRRQIEQGRRSGRLTPSEAARLRSDLEQLVREEMRWRAERDRRLQALTARTRRERAY